MGAELFAALRGIIGSVGNPLILYAIVLAIYLTYRKSSS
jgi:hypothetical protein